MLAYLVSRTSKILNTLVCCCAGDYAGLIAQLQSKLAMTQQQAAKDVGALTVDSQSIRAAIIAAGAVPLLISLLRSGQALMQGQQPWLCAISHRALGANRMPLWQQVRYSARFVVGVRPARCAKASSKRFALRCVGL